MKLHRGRRAGALRARPGEGFGDLGLGPTGVGRGPVLKRTGSSRDAPPYAWEPPNSGDSRLQEARDGFLYKNFGYPNRGILEVVRRNGDYPDIRLDPLRGAGALALGRGNHRMPLLAPGSDPRIGRASRARARGGGGGVRCGDFLSDARHQFRVCVCRDGIVRGGMRDLDESRQRSTSDSADLDGRVAACTAPDRCRSRQGHVAVAYWQRGRAYLYKSLYDRALADFETALGIDPENAVAYNGRGASNLRKRRYDTAINDFNRSIRINPDYALAYNDRGLAYSNKREFDRAIADLDRAIRLDPGSTRLQEPRQCQSSRRLSRQRHRRLRSGDR